jgi:hypothetical protein
VPWLGALDPVIWFGAIRGVLAVISLAATEVARRRVDTRRSVLLAWVLMRNLALDILQHLAYPIKVNRKRQGGTLWIKLDRRLQK